MATRRVMMTPAWRGILSRATTVASVRASSAGHRGHSLASLHRLAAFHPGCVAGFGSGPGSLVGSRAASTRPAVEPQHVGASGTGRPHPARRGPKKKKRMPSPAQRLRQTLSKRIVMAMENSERGTRMRQFLFDTDVRPVVECIERSNALAREVGSSTIDSFAPCDVVALARTMVRHRVRDKSLWVAVREAAAQSLHDDTDAWTSGEVAELALVVAQTRTVSDVRVRLVCCLSRVARLIVPLWLSMMVHQAGSLMVTLARVASTRDVASFSSQQLSWLAWSFAIHDPLGSGQFVAVVSRLLDHVHEHLAAAKGTAVAEDATFNPQQLARLLLASSSRPAQPVHHQLEQHLWRTLDDLPVDALADVCEAVVRARGRNRPLVKRLASRVFATWRGAPPHDLPAVLNFLAHTHVAAGHSGHLRAMAAAVAEPADDSCTWLTREA